MMTEIIDNYAKWLREETEVFPAGTDWQEIVTPFLSFNNDNLEVYYRTEANGNITFADDKKMLRELEMAGVNIASKSRKKEINSILRSRGIKLVDEELITTVPAANANMALHQFIQASLELLHLQVLSKEKIKNYFLEDFKDFLALSEVDYFSNMVIYGQSGLPHTFNFALPRTKNRSETVIQTVATPRKDLIENTIFTLTDAIASRDDLKGIVVLNDEKEIKPGWEQALINYDIPYFRYSQRSELIKSIAA
jgi:hypothetical protein